MRNAFHSFIKVFSSVRLAVVLFIALAAIILVGTSIPQEPLVGRSNLISKYGLQTYNTLKFWRLNDVFHSWWYLALLFLLALNMTVASIKRVFPGYRKAVFWPRYLNEVPGVDLERALQATCKIETWEELKKNLQKNLWELRVNPQDNSLIARKGAYHRLGPTITHIGILSTLLGAFISLLWGFNGVIQGVPGDRFILSDKEDSLRSYILVSTSQVFHAPLWLGRSPEFEVELGETSRENYPDGRPKQWTTRLNFFNNQGKALEQGIASVNHPVNFQGTDFYQADWNRILKLNFNGQSFEIKLDKIKNAEVAFTSVTPELGLLFMLPEQKQKLTLISLVGRPSSQVFQRPAELLKSGYLKPLASLEPGQSLKLGPMNLKFVGAFSKTGLQYKHSPGDWIMIGGMSILILGVLIAFGHKRTLWAIKAPQQNRIFIIANSDRAKDLFKKEFEELLKRIS